MINTILKSVFMICIVLAIVLLFSGHFSLQARHEQLKLDFDGHWHYQPKDVPDFTFEAVQDALLALSERIAALE